MKILMKALKYFVMGMMVGSLFYVITGIYTNPLTLKFKLLFLGASGLIGLLSFIFSVEQLGLITSWILHGVATFVIIVGLNFSLNEQAPLFQYPTLITFILEFILIYIIICVIAVCIYRYSTKQINEDIKKRK